MFSGYIHRERDIFNSESPIGNCESIVASGAPTVVYVLMQVKFWAENILVFRSSLGDLCTLKDGGMNDVSYLDVRHQCFLSTFFRIFH